MSQGEGRELKCGSLAKISIQVDRSQRHHVTTHEKAKKKKIHDLELQDQLVINRQRYRSIISCGLQHNYCRIEDDNIDCKMVVTNVSRCQQTDKIQKTFLDDLFLWTNLGFVTMTQKKESQVSTIPRLNKIFLKIFQNYKGVGEKNFDKILAILLL